MFDLLRDSVFGQLVHFASGRKLFKFPEQKDDFIVPERYSKSFSRTSTRTLIGNVSPKGQETPKPTLENNPPSPSDLEKRLSKSPSQKEMARIATGNLVDWYSAEDQENPQNWSSIKKVWITFLIAFLTFSVYIGSAIITPSIPSLMEVFGISQVHATLTLSLYVLGYGIGPIFLSPLSEIPAVGRNAVYMITLLLFVVLQVPTFLAGNSATLLAMRFLGGLASSPVLATGGASLADIHSQLNLPYAIVAWSIGAVSAPALGPVLSGFAIQSTDRWEWSIWILMMISGSALILLFFTLPETYAPTILYRRAARLRHVTGDKELQSQSEVDQEFMSATDILGEALYRPFRLMLEPVILYGDLYIGVVYALFYLFFESFPIVFSEYYHLSLGVSSLPFLALIVGCIITGIMYILYLKYYDIPKILRNGFIPEDRLLIALYGSPIVPISMLWFGLGYKVHYMFPTVGAGLFPFGVFLLFQSLMVYLPVSYQKYAASVLAGNDLVRSSLACAFPLFGRAMFTKLGLQGGSALLAGLTILLIPPLWILYKYGAKIRAHSKLATPVQ